MKKSTPTIIYYTDEQNDDFAGVSKKTLEIPSDFKFVHKSIIWRALAFIAYRVIMTPFAYIYCKLKFHLKIADNTTVPVKSAKGCFMYSNHTMLAGDAFAPSVTMFPKKVYVMVNTENISTPGTKNFLLMNGAIPIPKSVAAFKGFFSAINQRIDEGHCVTIYPEAHIWRYYTKIRPFESKSFRFAVKCNAPIYVSTTTFQKKRFGKTPRVTIYLDGPFYPNAELSPRKAEKELRNAAYNTMCERAKNSTYSPIEYRKKEEINDDFDNVRGQ